MKYSIKYELVLVCLLFSVSALYGETFYLYNHANLKEGLKPSNQTSTDYIEQHLSAILPGVTDVTPEKEFPLSAEVVKNLTDLTVGQKVVIIEKDAIRWDKIRTINLRRLENNGNFIITFDFDKDYDGIFFFPKKQLKYTEEPRNVSGAKFSLENEIEQAKATASFLLNRTTSPYKSDLIINDWKGDIFSELKRDFSSESFGNDSFSISQYRPIPQSNKADFIMARFGKAAFFFPYAIFLNLFQMNGQYYLLKEGYIPGTGAGGRVLYLLDGDKIIQVASNYNYSD